MYLHRFMFKRHWRLELVSSLFLSCFEHVKTQLLCLACVECQRILVVLGFVALGSMFDMPFKFLRTICARVLNNINNNRLSKLGQMVVFLEKKFESKNKVHLWKKKVLKGDWDKTKLKRWNGTVLQFICVFIFIGSLAICARIVTSNKKWGQNARKKIKKMNPTSSNHGTVHSNDCSILTAFFMFIHFDVYGHRDTGLCNEF